MSKLISALLILGIIALLGVGAYTWHMSECWSWYDAGYDDAMDDWDIEIINGHRIVNERDWLMWEAGYDFAFEYIDLEPVAKPTEVELCGQTYCRTSEEVR